MTTNLQGTAAVITGAAGGIGLGVARAAAKAGMKLVLADIDESQLAQVCKDLSAAGHEILGVPTDIADPDAIDRLAKAALERFGSPRLLLNNAGIEMLGKAWELSAAQWEKAMRINVLGPVNGVRAFAPAMIAAGAPAFISNVASIGGLGMSGDQTPYILSKHAVLSFSEGLFLGMMDAAPHIAVSAVLPGPVRTRIFTDAPVAQADGIDDYRAEMETMLIKRGLSSDEAGQMIFDQIIGGRYWVTTHPEMLEAAAQSRANYLLSLGKPSDRVKPTIL